MSLCVENACVHSSKKGRWCVGQVRRCGGQGCVGVPEPGLGACAATA